MTTKQLDLSHAYDKLDDRNAYIRDHAIDLIARSQRLHEKCLELDILVVEALAFTSRARERKSAPARQSEPHLPMAA